MPEVRYLPRNLPIDELIETLVKEHTTMREQLQRTKQAAERKDFKDASRSLRQLDGMFRQHIADEESQILRLLVDELGVKGAEQEIRVFQQHRPIYRLMQDVSELATKEAADLSLEDVRLIKLFDEHVSAEEGSVFPRAVSCRELSSDH
jgi:hemerythrin-like domain-containing protein